MEYKNIIAAVPTGEHFDTSAINEGVWMSVAHLNSIETSMADAATQVQAAIQNTADGILITQQGQSIIESLNANIAERDAAIEAQATEIASLKAAPAAAITQTAKDIDEQGSKAVFESETTKEARLRRELRDGKKN